MIDFMHTNELGAQLVAVRDVSLLDVGYRNCAAEDRSMNVLGISAFYHDSAAALVQDGTIVAAAQEERFTRKKNDADFPRRAIAYCLHAGHVPRNGIDAIVFYEKPLTTFSRLLRTYLKVGLRGAFVPFEQAMPVWFREKLWIPYLIERELREIGFRMPKQLWFTEHHESHTASAFFASPFTSAAILTFDGVGEFATSSIRDWPR